MDVQFDSLLMEKPLRNLGRSKLLEVVVYCI